MNVVPGVIDIVLNNNGRNDYSLIRAQLQIVAPNYHGLPTKVEKSAFRKNIITTMLINHNTKVYIAGWNHQTTIVNYTLVDTDLNDEVYRRLDKLIMAIFRSLEQN